MRKIILILSVILGLAALQVFSGESKPPVRIAIIGLVHSRAKPEAGGTDRPTLQTQHEFIF
jgi:hypothetical protein